MPHLFRINAQLANTVERLARERLVDLIHIDVIERQARLLHSGRDRNSGAHAHDRRVHTNSRKASEDAHDG
jgi:hypothetical protein